MFQVRKSNERGHFNHGWLDTYHTFSFADYYDPDHHNFRSLRVMNEDQVAPGQGFGMHGHRAMEIVTYLLSGELEHKDSMGNGEVLRPGEFQRMTAGTGIQHSEFNPSRNMPVHLYQIWIMPRQKGLTPTYEQKSFPESERTDRLRVVASPDGRDGSLTIQQDASIFLSTLTTGARILHEIAPQRHAWLQVLRGNVEAGGHFLAAGDGLAVSQESALSIEAKQNSEVMLFDLN